MRHAAAVMRPAHLKHLIRPHVTLAVPRGGAGGMFRNEPWPSQQYSVGLPGEGVHSNMVPGIGFIGSTTIRELRTISAHGVPGLGDLHSAYSSTSGKLAPLP